MQDFNHHRDVKGPAPGHAPDLAFDDVHPVRHYLDIRQMEAQSFRNVSGCGPRRLGEHTE
jgi:hypothetical protein